MKRFRLILLLAASILGCSRDRSVFSQEFWVDLDGSGTFAITAPAFVWNSVKNVGEARDVEATVTTGRIEELFMGGDVRLTDVARESGKTPGGRVVARGRFTSLNSLVGHRAFPDLVLAWRLEGERIRVFGVWRRPPGAGTAQGPEDGTMELRFHLPSEIHETRGAPTVERGNVLLWSQSLQGGLAGAPIDFGATLGTVSVRRSWLTWTGIGLACLFVVTLLLRKAIGQRPPRARLPPRRDKDDDDSAFLNYDPNAGSSGASSKSPLS